MCFWECVSEFVSVMCFRECVSNLLLVAIANMIQNEVRKFSAPSLHPPLLKRSYVGFCFVGGNCVVCLKQPRLRLFKQGIFCHSYLFLDWRCQKYIVLYFINLIFDLSSFSPQKYCFEKEYNLSTNVFYETLLLVHLHHNKLKQKVNVLRTLSRQQENDKWRGSVSLNVSVYLENN